MWDKLRILGLGTAIRKEAESLGDAKQPDRRIWQCGHVCVRHTFRTPRRQSGPTSGSYNRKRVARRRILAHQNRLRSRRGLHERHLLMPVFVPHRLWKLFGLPGVDENCCSELAAASRNRHGFSIVRVWSQRPPVHHHLCPVLSRRHIRLPFTSLYRNILSHSRSSCLHSHSSCRAVSSTFSTRRTRGHR